MEQPTRILIIEREPLLRRGLASSLEAVEAFDVVAHTNARDEAMRVLQETPLDVALVGTTVPEAPSVELAADVCRRFPSVATIVVSSDETDDELFAAVRAGASAYCGRSIEEEHLHQLIQRSAGGEFVINEQLLTKPYVAARVLDQFRDSNKAEERPADEIMPLTDRELDILRNVSAGLTNAEIGYALGISSQTVKNHVTSILRKLAVNDRTQAVVTALRHGWLSIDDVQPSANGRTHRHSSDSHAEGATRAATTRDSGTNH